MMRKKPAPSLMLALARSTRHLCRVGFSPPGAFAHAGKQPVVLSLLWVLEQQVPLVLAVVGMGMWQRGSPFPSAASCLPPAHSQDHFNHPAFSWPGKLAPHTQHLRTETSDHLPAPPCCSHLVRELAKLLPSSTQQTSPCQPQQTIQRTSTATGWSSRKIKPAALCARRHSRNHNVTVFSRAGLLNVPPALEARIGPCLNRCMLQ